MPGLDTIKDVSIVVAGCIALVTFVTGILEYRRRGRQERAETFVQMRRRFQENPIFRKTLDCLSTDDPAVTEISIQDRRNLVGFLEEVGLMVNSGLLRPEVARLMFGVYVEMVDRSTHFWEGLDRNSKDWTVYHRLRDRLHALDGGSAARDSQLRF